MNISALSGVALYSITFDRVLLYGAFLMRLRIYGSLSDESTDHTDLHGFS